MRIHVKCSDEECDFYRNHSEACADCESNRDRKRNREMNYPRLKSRASGESNGSSDW